MFWTVEKLQNFAVENGMSVDDAFKAVQLGYIFTGLMQAYIFHEIFTSAPVRKFLSRLCSRSSSRDDTSSGP